MKRLNGGTKGAGKAAGAGIGAGAGAGAGRGAAWPRGSWLVRSREASTSNICKVVKSTT